MSMGYACPRSWFRAKHNVNSNCYDSISKSRRCVADEMIRQLIFGLEARFVYVDTSKKVGDPTKSKCSPTRTLQGVAFEYVV
jgi:hypothetical protein